MSNKVIANKEKADIKLLTIEVQNLTEEVATQNSNATFLKIAFRGFINGVFSALGATIGFTVVIFFLAQAFRGADNIPLLDSVLQRTQLDKIIDYQLEQIQQSEKEEDQDEEDAQAEEDLETVTPTPSVTPEEELVDEQTN